MLTNLSAWKKFKQTNLSIARFHLLTCFQMLKVSPFWLQNCQTKMMVPSSLVIVGKIFTMNPKLWEKITYLPHIVHSLPKVASIIIAWIILRMKKATTLPSWQKSALTNTERGSMAGWDLGVVCFNGTLNLKWVFHMCHVIFTHLTL